MNHNINSIRAKLAKNVEAKKHEYDAAVQQNALFEHLAQAVKDGTLSREVVDGIITSMGVQEGVVADTSSNGTKKTTGKTLPPPPPTPQVEATKPSQPPQRLSKELSLKDGIRVVLGTKTMDGQQIYDELKKRNFAINSNNPLKYVRYTLSANPEIFHRAGRGIYRLSAEPSAKGARQAPAGKKSRRTAEAVRDLENVPTNIFDG